MKAVKTAVAHGAWFVASMAGKAAKESSSSSCVWFFRQPKVPANLRDFCKK